jgi:hypothetical protein
MPEQKVKGVRSPSLHESVLEKGDVKLTNWPCYKDAGGNGGVAPIYIVLPSSTYLFTAGVEVVYFHLITLRHTPQSVGLLWTRDLPVAETST